MGNFRSSARFEKGLLGNDLSLGQTGLNLPIEILNGIEYVYRFEDFNTTPSAPTDPVADMAVCYDYVETAVTTGAARILVDGEGVMQLDGGTTTDDGTVVQYLLASAAAAEGLGVPLNTTAGTNQQRLLSFGARFRLLDVDGSNLFVGLAIDHATSAVLGTTTTDDPAASHAGVFMNETATAMTFQCAGDDGVVASAAETVTLADNTYVEIALSIHNKNDVTFAYRLNTQPTWKRVNSGVAIVATDTMDDHLVPTFATVGQGAGDDLDIDYFWYNFARRSNLRDNGTTA